MHFKKVKIMYFSGTGNTRYLCDCFAETIREKGIDVDICDISEYYGREHTVVSFKSIDRDCLYVFAFPVYAYGPPGIFLRFLKDKLPYGEGAEAVVMINAGENFGAAIDIASARLSKRGYNVISSVSVFMPQNYIPILKTPEESKANVMIERGKYEIRAFAERLAEGIYQKGKQAYRIIIPFLRVIYFFFINFGNHIFSITLRAGKGCNGCGVCERICPLMNIEMRDGKPVIGKRCEMCVRCVNYCPKDTLNVGLSKGRARYRIMKRW